MHDDHCNLLKEFLTFIKPMLITTHIWIPKINNPEKIHLLLTSELDKESYNDFFNFILNPGEFLNADIGYIPPEIPLETDSRKGFYRETGKNKHDWVIDPLVINGSISNNLLQFIKTKLSNNLNELSDYDKCKEFKKEYNKEMKIAGGHYHLTMLCLYAGPASSLAYTSGSYCHRRYSVRAGWMHTGDAILKKLSSHNFYIHYKNYAACIGFMQIPHHGSSANPKGHDENFAIDMFRNAGYFNRIFYFTHSISEGNAKPRVDDIFPPIRIYPISEFPECTINLTSNNEP
jgi:hypothetical protein